MRHEIKTAIAGVAAGVLISGFMAVGRRAGVVHKTLAEDAEDWLDRTADSRRYLEQPGTTVAEQVGHIGASAVFGFLYGALQRSVPGMPPWSWGRSTAAPCTR